MPPKTAEEKASSENSKKKSRSPQSYAAQKLCEVTVARGRLIAGSLGIQNYAKLNKDALIPLIREHLALVENCVECGGGPCLPDDHVFPATEPGSTRASASDGNDSDTSKSDDSPSRQHLQSLNRTQHPSDVVVPGFETRTSFTQHVTDQLMVEHEAGLSASGLGSSSGGQQGSSSGVPRTPVHPLREEPPLSVSSDEEELGSDFAAALREQQAQWDLEFNTTHNSLAQQKKDDAAAAARRKKERQERRRVKEQQLLEEAKQKHLDRMKALQAETRSRASRNSSQGDNDVFESGSRQSRPASRVSFPQQTSPRSESARPAPSDHYHPEYSGNSQRTPPRSRSTGSSLDMDVLTALMDKQAESQALMAAAIDKLASAGAGAGRVPISSLGGFAAPESGSHCHKSSSSGNLQMVKPGNPAMARALGVNPRVNWAFKGDMDDVDISKLKKMNLVSGKNRTNEGLVLQQHYWPHDCVSRASLHLLPAGFNFAKLKHEDLSFAMFQEGFAQKILMDTASLDKTVKHKLMFQSKLIRMSYTLPWTDILSISEQFFEAFEFNQASWDDWDEIERFLKDAYEQAKMASFLKPGVVPAGAASNPLAPAAAANPRGPKKERKYVDNANGVPWKYMKEQKICGGYNIGSCERKGDHKIGSETVFHYCAGCFGKSKGEEKKEHRAVDCPKGPFDRNLFG